MRQGTRRKMPRKSTGLTDRLTLPMRPELLREIDQVRGDVPRVAWIRRELALAVTRHRPGRGSATESRNDPPARCVALPRQIITHQMSWASRVVKLRVLLG